MPAPTFIVPAQEYRRVVTILRNHYKRLVPLYVQPDAETRDTLLEIRVMLTILSGCEATWDLPLLPPRHKLEPEGVIGHERSKGRHDATKW
jgi:hypothetical protein